MKIYLISLVLFISYSLPVSAQKNFNSSKSNTSGIIKIKGDCISPGVWDERSRKCFKPMPDKARNHKNSNGKSKGKGRNKAACVSPYIWSERSKKCFKPKKAKSHNSSRSNITK